jgi:glucose-1-phosphate cytidylyltransferase
MARPSGEVMKVAILAGGVGNRLGGDTKRGPKPMVEIGGRPLVWHIMRHYSHFGYNEFDIAAGHQADHFKQYFATYHITQADVRIDVAAGSTTSLQAVGSDDWVVDVIDTGRWTQSGGRIKRIGQHIGQETFMVTFGDAVSNVNLDDLLSLHESHDRLLTVTAVHPPPRFGELQLEGSMVAAFSEKPLESGWVNGGYMVIEPGAIEYISGDEDSLSPGAFERLTNANQLAAFRHSGFWLALDTLRDRSLLERHWNSENPPWRMS